MAKYGDKSVYFDLEDLGNTTGQWDVYGSDAPSPYNSLQVCMSNYTSKVHENTKYCIWNNLLIYDDVHLIAEQVFRDIRCTFYQERIAAQVLVTRRWFYPCLLQLHCNRRRFADCQGPTTETEAWSTWQNLI